MVNNRVNLNIVYAPQPGPDRKIFENEHGEIWHSKKKHPQKINIGMGWYSIRDPKPGDNILVLEPFCVLPKDYNIPFLKRFKYIFTWATKAITNHRIKKRVIEINHPSCLGIEREKVGKGWVPWKQRKNEIVFIANNKSSTHNSELYSLRLQLADFLSKQQSKYKISWYGHFKLKRPYYKGPIRSKHDILRQVKFSICTENCYHPAYSFNYFTEKLPEVWKGGAVPLYMGCYNIDAFSFPSQSYIDLRNFTKRDGKEYNILGPKLMERIKSYSENEYERYLQKLKNKIMIPQALYHHISYKRMWRTMINTFYRGQAE